MKLLIAKNIGLIICVLISFTFFSCDPISNIDYVIDNRSENSLEVISRGLLDVESDTNFIANQTEFILHEAFIIGRTTRRVLNETEDLPFRELGIKNDEGELYQPDLLDIDQWKKIRLRDDNERGIIKLVVTDDDFN